MNYFDEQRRWDEQVVKWLGYQAELIGVSKLSSDIRVYRTKDRVVKVRLLTPASTQNRPAGLEDEYLVLCWLRDGQPRCSWVPVVQEYRREGAWEMMSMLPMDVPYMGDPVVRPEKESLRKIAAVARRVWSLNRMGVSHGDLTPSNAGRNSRGNFVLLDFDQSVPGPAWRCVLRDFLGMPQMGRVVQFSMFDRLMTLLPVRLRLGARAGTQIEGGTNLLSNPLGLASRCRASGDPRLVEMAEVWSQASGSGANSPGAGVAYYSIDVSGIHFPGERPWALRWDMIRRRVDFSDKRVVELGCNLGLFSIHACVSGAKSVAAADHNQEVILAAKRISGIFRVAVDFQQVDFDQDEGWEQRLGSGDLVTALSLTYWLRDKERLWRYLSGFPEVIFEGHEPSDDIEERFSAMGFISVTKLGVSERSRTVYLARKPSVPPSLH